MEKECEERFPEKSSLVKGLALLVLLAGLGMGCFDGDGGYYHHGPMNYGPSPYGQHHGGHHGGHHR